MKLKRKLQVIYWRLSQRRFLDYFLIFIVSFLLFTFLQSTLTFADPDSFYHAKMAVLIKEQGLVFDFPYLQFTVLKDIFTDHHLLYHIALVPFIIFLKPLIAIKLATIFFASLTIVVFYWLLKKLGIRAAWFYCLVLLVNNPFIFRLNLAKAQALALTALFLAFYFITHRKFLSLFILSFFYVWLYGGWPLMLIVTVIYILSSYIPLGKPRLVERIKSKFFITLFRQKLCQKSLNWQNLNLLLVVTGGLLAGLIINPYFPKNLFFYWQQIIQIAVINYQKIIGVGGEWYHYGLLDLITSSIFVFTLLIFGLTLFILFIKKQKTINWFFLFLTIFFFVLTLKSRRNVEYFEPLAVLFAAAAINVFVNDLEFKMLYFDLKKFILRQKIVLVILVMPLIIFSYTAYKDLGQVYRDNKNGIAFNQFRKAAIWLKNNTSPGETVFHSDWDEFPILFFYNSSNNYLVGLDPTFMYNYDKDLYWQWYRVTTGQETENLYNIIKKEFGANYVFIDWPSHQLLNRNMANNFLFEQVYSDSQAKIYKVY